MLISLSFFLWDFILYGLLDQWFFYTLVTQCIFLNLYKNYSLKDHKLLFVLFLLIIQDYFLYGRVGLICTYLIPVLIIGRSLRTVVNKNWLPAIFCLLIVSFFTFEFLIVKKWLFGIDCAWNSTITKILLNLIMIPLIYIASKQ